MNVAFYAFQMRPKAPQIGTTERTSSTDEVECDSTRSEGARKGMEVAEHMKGSTGSHFQANHRSDWFPSLWSAFVALLSRLRCDRSVRPKESYLHEIYLCAT